MTSNTMTERTVRVNGKEIFVAEEGDGPPVVLLHGGGPGASGVSNYSRNIEPLAQQYRVIVPDMPGYGRTTKGVDGTDPFGYLADHIRGVLDELGIDRAHLVGNSYGGACALRLALDTPHRVDRLVLMGPGGIGTTRGLPTAGLKSLLGYYAGDGPSLDKLETFIRTYLVFNAEPCRTPSSKPATEATIDPEVVAAPPLRRPSGPAHAVEDGLHPRPRLSPLAAPTLVLWGATTRSTGPAAPRCWPNACPTATCTWCANTGHWVQFERADLFNAVTTDFLAG